MAVYAKAVGEISDWQTIDDTASDAPSSQSAEISNLTELIKAVVVTVAHKDTNDAAANFVTIRLLAKLGTADPDVGKNWKTIAIGGAGGGQAVTEALNAESASGQKEIQVAATTDWDTGLCERLLLLNVGDNLLSELVTLNFWDDADHYTVIKNLANTHDAGDGDALFDGVDEVQFQIPAWTTAAKFVVANSDGDANYLWRVDYGEVQSLG